tara:strand:- start:1486 stop:2379 length:894 start_codon:yes stop_codon:yes gene_type:complete
MTRKQGWFGEKRRHSLASKKGWRTRRKYPLMDTELDIDQSIDKNRNFLKKKMGKRDYSTLKKIESRTAGGWTTKNKYTDLNEKYHKRRKTLHKNIIKKTFSDKSAIDKSDPDFYVLGGVAGSGKSFSLLRKIKEPVLVLNNDDFKQKLSKRSKSPIKKFPLIHAGHFHNEAGDILTKSLKNARKKRYNVVLDGTLNSISKVKKVAQNYKRDGYDVHLLATQMKPTVSVKNTTTRFLETGRYVPPEVIAKSGNKINKNVMDFRKIADSHVILDTTNFGNVKHVSKGGNIKIDYRKPKK